EEIVSRFHGPSAGPAAREEFIARFQKGALLEDMSLVELQSGADGLPIANVLRDAGLTPSTSEALRMIRQGAVRIDGERIEATDLRVPADSDNVLQVGKRRIDCVRIRGA